MGLYGIVVVIKEGRDTLYWAMDTEDTVQTTCYLLSKGSVVLVEAPVW